VIRSFADSATEDVFDGARSKAARRFSAELWPRMRRVLDQLNTVESVGEMRVPPGNRLEKLRGDRAGRWSVRVSDQFRVTFRFADGHAWEVRIEDYH
jgi:proteic killer suppression protein